MTEQQTKYIELVGSMSIDCLMGKSSFDHIANMLLLVSQNMQKIKDKQDNQIVNDICENLV